ncbi:MAG: PEP-CTERM sorting domain-containing protein [Planctomycetia bacterium]|nr:PEP-CTERM sorting domain-containing protein [Planctomycetia bacterium]
MFHEVLPYLRTKNNSIYLSIYLILFATHGAFAQDAAYTDLDNTTTASEINITGELTLTTTVSALPYPTFSRDITANGLELISSSNTSAEWQVLSGNIQIGTGGLAVTSGTLDLSGAKLSFTGASTFTVNSLGSASRANLVTDSNTEITAIGGNLDIDISRTLSLNGSLNLGDNNVSIAFVTNKTAINSIISGTGQVTYKTNADRTGGTVLEVYSSNTYSVGTLITSLSGNTNTVLARAYENTTRPAGTYLQFGSTTQYDQYYYTSSFGTGTITLSNSGLSNGDSNRIVFGTDVEILLPEDKWGVIRAGSASSTAKVQYLVIESKITGDGHLYIAKDSGTVLITNPLNDYTGGTHIGTSPMNYTSTFRAGIEIGADNVLGTGPVVLNDPDAILDLNGHKLEIGGLSSLKYDTDGTYLNDVYIYDASVDQAAVLTVVGGSEYIYAGKFTDSSGNNPLTRLVKTGEGTQTFWTVLSENLTLTVEGGTVKLSRDETGAMYGGILAAPIVNGGAITSDYEVDYGASTNYLDIACGTYTDGTLRVDIASLTEFSRFDLVGSLDDLSYKSDLGFIDVNILGAFAPSDEDSFILSYDATVFNAKGYTTTTDFESWLRAEDRELWDLTWYVGDAIFGTSLVLERNPMVPEPASWLLLAWGFLGMLFRKKFRK